MQPLDDSVELSVVAPVYQAEAFIDSFYHRMSAIASQFTSNYEVIFVNDGSTDSSLEKLIAMQEKDPHVVVIELSRNFGMHPAIRCGLEHATGRYTFLIASDLQEAPEWLPQLYDKLLESKADIVYAREIKRINTLSYRILCKGFYSVIRFLCPSDVIEIAVARLMTKQVRDALVAFHERSTVLDVLCWLAGFQYDFIEVVKAPRKGSSFTFGKRFTQAICDHITSMTIRPLLWVGYLAFFYIITGISMWALGYPKSTEKSAGILVLGMAGVLVILVIFGIYLSVLFREIKQRPLFFVRAIYQTPRSSTVGQ